MENEWNDLVDWSCNHGWKPRRRGDFNDIIYMIEFKGCRFHMRNAKPKPSNANYSKFRVELCAYDDIKSNSRERSNQLKQNAENLIQHLIQAGIPKNALTHEPNKKGNYYRIYLNLESIHSLTHNITDVHNIINRFANTLTPLLNAIYTTK